MPTIVSHPAAALALAPWYRPLLKRPSIVVAGTALTLLPDIDVLAFRFGIPYEHLLGHRGLTHSLPFALMFSGLLAWPMYRRLQVGLPILWSYFALCLASHGLLDALTNGGLGVAFFAPFSNERFFFDLQPIQVSPIGIERFLSTRAQQVLASELLWIWAPAALIGMAGLLVRWFRRHAAMRREV